MKWPRRKKKEKDDLNICPLCGKDCKSVEKYRKHVKQTHRG